ncbi:ATP--cobalamin adenosyltransferase [Rhodopirellula sallentina SM41]|uniref:Corrinoid adenosyltransferase n=2 Tax=Rhodopirellula TaxID=265488 RepID=M5UC03_9BACT|nr:ATP--cobalamin adenosyltransferase [Rhodopirellula sallentina SM41]
MDTQNLDDPTTTDNPIRPHAVRAGDGMKIYTRTGDSGTTGLFGGPRVAKDDTRIEAYGTVDELNAVLGCVRCELASALQNDSLESDRRELLAQLDDRIVQVQHELFSLGAELASPHPDQFDLRVIGADHIDRLEKWIDETEQRLPPLKQFILPGGSPTASQIHFARAVCRRSERRVITLADSVQSETPIGDEVIVYLNRLSDWLFVVSRDVNRLLGREDQPWQKP